MPAAMFRFDFPSPARHNDTLDAAPEISTPNRVNKPRMLSMKHFYCRRIFTLGLLTMAPLALLAHPLTTRADDAPPAPSADTGLLGPTYRDEPNGFEINPPAGSRLVQKAGAEALSFVQEQKQFGGTVTLSTTGPDSEHPNGVFTLKEMLDLAATDLSAAAHNVKVNESRETTASGKPAGLLSMALELDGDNGTRVPLLKQQLIVRAAPTHFVTLTLVAPLAAKEEATQLFSAMAGTLTLLDHKELAKRRLNAIKAGKAWFDALSAESLVPKLSKSPRMFRILVNNKDVGYVEYLEDKTDREGYKGVTITCRSRSFPSNGSVISAGNSSFWAFTQQPKTIAHYSSWNNLSTTNFPALNPDSPQAQILNNVNGEIGTLQLENDAEGVRVYGITITRTGSSGGLTQDLGTLHWTIPVDSSPLPKLLEILWPRLVDLTKPTEMGFVCFNAATSKLALRMLSVKGPDTITIDGRKTPCIRLADEITPNINTMWVDDAGVMLMLRSSDGTLLIPTTQDAMERLWGRKLAELGQTAGPLPNIGNMSNIRGK